MSKASPQIQELARRLLVRESSPDSSPDENTDVVLQVIAELRTRLVRLAGLQGFRSLLLRALTLARAEIPSLASVQVLADGSLDGFDKIDRSHEANEREAAGILLVARLLELLVTFIGTPLTLRLLRDKWPDVSIEETALSIEEKP
ncbi:MAG TPA: hypothetical protein VMS31_10325 [Pyrinomonadaceae bacterium]|nr:hypothetical protein [Pyrinomonadaceae bacterium]